jgi:hypothetical protein
MSDLQETIDIRKRKKDLYISLLKKGLNNLSDTEKQILHYLSVDGDILLMLVNGFAFNEG